MGYSPWDLKESDTTEQLTLLNQAYFILFFFLKKAFCFVLGYRQVTSKVITSGEQQKDSAIHIHVSILPQTLLPSRLPCNIEQSSMCYSAGPVGNPL